MLWPDKWKIDKILRVFTAITTYHTHERKRKWQFWLWSKLWWWTTNSTKYWSYIECEYGEYVSHFCIKIWRNSNAIFTEIISIYLKDSERDWDISQCFHLHRFFPDDCLVCGWGEGLYMLWDWLVCSRSSGQTVSPKKYSKESKTLLHAWCFLIVIQTLTETRR